MKTQFYYMWHFPRRGFSVVAGSFFLVFFSVLYAGFQKIIMVKERKQNVIILECQQGRNIITQVALSPQFFVSIGQTLQGTAVLHGIVLRLGGGGVWVHCLKRTFSFLSGEATLDRPTGR
jgi:hypothetical protein